MRHLKTGYVLVGIAVLAWLAVGAQLATHLLDGEACAALRSWALALTISAGLARAAEVIVGALREHTVAMTEHVLAIERFFQLSVRADAQCEVDARLATGTGTFKVYPGGRTESN